MDNDAARTDLIIIRLFQQTLRFLKASAFAVDLYSLETKRRRLPMYSVARGLSRRMASTLNDMRRIAPRGTLMMLEALPRYIIVCESSYDWLRRLGLRDLAETYYQKDNYPPFPITMEQVDPESDRLISLMFHQTRRHFQAALLAYTMYDVERQQLRLPPNPLVAERAQRTTEYIKVMRTCSQRNTLTILKNLPKLIRLRDMCSTWLHRLDLHHDAELAYLLV